MFSLFGRNIGADDLSFALDAGTDAATGALNEGSGTVSSKSPQMAYMWEIEIVGTPQDGDTSNFKFYAKNTSVPSVLVEEIKRYYAGVEYILAGRDMSPRRYQVTFFDNEALEIYRYFTKWKQLCSFGEEGMKTSPKKYMKEVKLKLRDISDSVNTEVFTFVDCFPTEIGAVELSYENSSEFTFDVVFSFRRKKLIGEK